MKRFVVLPLAFLLGCFPSPPPPQPPPPPADYYAAGMQGRAAINAQAASMGIAEAQVVPASEAPPPPSGKGWFCFDYQEQTDYADPRTQDGHAMGDTCVRTLAECQEVARERVAAGYADRAKEVTYDVGSCTAQARAACSYWFARDAHECHRTMARCKDQVGGAALIGPGGDPRQADCAEHG